MQFSGDLNDVCPISFVPVAELEHPVGFDARHAFECECIVEWLTKHKSTNPITGENIGSVPMASVLHPLIVGECDRVAETAKILSNADMTKGTLPAWHQKVQNDVYLIVLLGLVTWPALYSVLVAACVASFRADYPISGMPAIFQCALVSFCDFTFSLQTFSMLLLVHKLMYDVASIVFGCELL